MTTIAIDPHEVMQNFGTLPGKTRTESLVWILRNPPDHRWQHEANCALADAIEAAADKRVIVLNVDELGLDNETDRIALMNWARDGGRSTVQRIARAVLDALDSLTPPRPPEPTGPTCVCPSGPDLEGPVAWCDVHGQPSAAYLAGKADAVRDVADQLELIKRGGVTS